MSRSLGRIFSIARSVGVFLRSYFALSRMEPFAEVVDGYKYVGLPYSDIGEFLELYYIFNDGVKISYLQKILINIYSEKCILAVYDNQFLVGFDYFYFNSRDFADETIHEGFIGVTPAHQRNGIASNLRKISMEHYNVNRLGISTRISTSNEGSFKSAKKHGFVVVDTYLENGAEERNYCVFKK